MRRLKPRSVSTVGSVGGTQIKFISRFMDAIILHTLCIILQAHPAPYLKNNSVHSSATQLLSECMLVTNAATVTLYM